MKHRWDSFQGTAFSLNESDPQCSNPASMAVTTGKYAFHLRRSSMYRELVTTFNTRRTLLYKPTGLGRVNA